MTAILTSRQAYEWYATLTIHALTSYVVGRNSNVPNRNHFIIATIASTCALPILKFLANHVAQYVHKKLGKQNQVPNNLMHAIWVPAHPLSQFILTRFSPLQLPPLATTLSYLFIIQQITLPVILLSSYFIP